MNNILYLIDCTEIPHLSISTSQALLNQDNLSTSILLFDDVTHKDMYYNYFLSNNITSSLLCINSNHRSILLLDILKNYLSQYEWFVVLSPYVLYGKNLTNEIMNLCKNNSKENFVFSPKDTQNPRAYSVSFHINSIQNFIRAQMSFADLLEKKQDVEKNQYSNIKIILNSSCWYDIEKAYNNSSVHHSDELSLFAKFLGTEDIADSFVYINKKNYKSYNIANNIMGEVISINPSNITMSWKIGNVPEPIKISYYFDNLAKCYIPQ